MYSVTWVPYLTYHFTNFVAKLEPQSDSPFVEIFFPVLVCLNPLLNTLTRLLCDPLMRAQLNCFKSQSQREFDMMMTSMIETERMHQQERTTDSTHHRPTAPTKPNEVIYDRLTQVETLNVRATELFILS